MFERVLKIFVGLVVLPTVVIVVSYPRPMNVIEIIEVVLVLLTIDFIFLIVWRLVSGSWKMGWLIKKDMVDDQIYEEQKARAFIELLKIFIVTYLKAVGIAVVFLMIFTVLLYFAMEYIPIR